MILNSDKAGDGGTRPAASRENIMEKSPSAYEAVVAIAKEARRLNAVPGVYLDQDEKPVHRAVKNFVDGRMGYEFEGDAPAKKKKKRARKSK